MITHAQEVGSGRLAEGLPPSSSAGRGGEAAQACAWDPHDPNKVAVLQGPALVQWDLRTFKCVHVRVFAFHARSWGAAHLTCPYIHTCIHACLPACP